MNLVASQLALSQLAPSRKMPNSSPPKYSLLPSNENDCSESSSISHSSITRSPVVNTNMGSSIKTETIVFVLLHILSLIIILTTFFIKRENQCTDQLSILCSTIVSTLISHWMHRTFDPPDQQEDADDVYPSWRHIAIYLISLLASLALSIVFARKFE